MGLYTKTPVPSVYINFTNFGNNIFMKIGRILILFFFFIIFLCIKNISYGSYLAAGIQNFPASYQPYLLELQKSHPNWIFTALYTGFDWKYVIDNQNVFGKNLVPKSYSDRWKNLTPGQYNVEVDSGWVDASRQAIEYTMDPRNFLNERRMFQFETLSYDPSVTTLGGIDKILYGTEFYNRIVEYKTAAGTNIVMSKKYSDLIMHAGITSGVSPYFLAARIKQEVGPFLSHNSISGTVSGYEGLYNFYNIGATSDPNYMQVIRNGLQYAKDGKGASQSTRDRYLIPWNTKERSITGGAIWIGSSYINVGQNTIYLQKFDVNDQRSSTLFWHQYMTNVLAPYSESNIVYTGYSNSGLLSSPMSFIIPVYNNMPAIPQDSPNISPSDFTDDNTKMYPNVSTVLNVRTGPGTSYDVITTISKADTLTRIKKGKQSGDLWDKVVLANGIVRICVPKLSAARTKCSDIRYYAEFG